MTGGGSGDPRGHGAAAVRTRRGCPADLDQVNALHGRCTPSSLSSRYHGALRRISPADWRRLVDPAHGVTWVMQEDRCPDDVIAVAHLMRTGVDGVAELGILVEDSRQGRGLGTRLVGQVLDHAAAAGCHTVTATVQAGNVPMLRIALGFGAPRPRGAAVMDLRIPVGPGGVPGSASR
ncbi:GNAT family N-acetyltransferase [Streptomyces sp. NBC_01190]|uniref:GNAT family N-acetyltransferase n=1 Tax=Streptomyces sp. NBC_01190 TaxID=2903767 RepID=UPI00386C28E2|nr:GNAT family N-acetyltransferase [Streptomyces sp. NBC_01190]